jgi:hypothetical protein
MPELSTFLTIVRVGITTSGPARKLLRAGPLVVWHLLLFFAALLVVVQVERVDEIAEER